MPRDLRRDFRRDFCELVQAVAVAAGSVTVLMSAFVFLA